MRHFGFKFAVTCSLILFITGVVLAYPMFGDSLALTRQQLYEKSDPIYAAFGGCGRPCHVTYSGGGYMRTFLSAARHALTHGVQVIFDGPCLSSCALFADKARDTVCVTPLATLGFHKSWAPNRRLFGSVEHSDPPQSTDIDQWVRANGGYHVDDFLIMRFRDALAFWKQCQSPKSVQGIERRAVRRGVHIFDNLL